MQVQNYDKRSPLKGGIKNKMSKLPFLASAIDFNSKPKMNQDLADYKIKKTPEQTATNF